MPSVIVTGGASLRGNPLFLDGDFEPTQPAQGVADIWMDEDRWTLAIAIAKAVQQLQVSNAIPSLSLNHATPSLSVSVTVPNLSASVTLTPSILYS